MTTPVEILEKIEKCVNSTGVIGDSISDADLLEIKDDNGWTALHLAVIFGYTEVAKAIIDKYPCTLDTTDKNWCTALHLAAASGHTEVVKAIIKKNSDTLKATNKSGWTALHLAAMNGHTEVVKAIIKKNSDTLKDKVKRTGWTALHWAAASGHTGVVKAIIAEDPTTLKDKDKIECTALHWAAAYGHIAVVNAIIAEDQDILKSLRIEDRYGRIPLHSAPNNRRTAAVTAMIKKDPTTLKIKDEYGRTVLHRAAMNGDTQLVKIIIAEDPDILETLKIRDNNRRTALDLADMYSNIAVEGILKSEQQKQRKEKIINEYGAFGRVLLCVSDRRVGVGLGFGMGFLASCAYCTKNSTAGLVSLGGGLIGLATSYIAKYFINIDKEEVKKER